MRFLKIASFYREHGSSEETNLPKSNSLTTKKQTTKSSFAKFQKKLRPSYIKLEIQRV